MCPNLFSYAPPSPVACRGCIATQLGFNPVRAFASSGFSEYPFVTWFFIVYLGYAILDAPKIYQGFQRNLRERVEWKDLSDRRKTITAFAVGFVAFLTFQYAATLFYYFVSPVPTLAFFGEGLLTIAVALWLARFRGWSLPIRGTSFPSISSATSGIYTTGTTDPAPTPSRGFRANKPAILGLLLLIVLVGGLVSAPAIYSSVAAALAPKSDIEVTANPSAFSAIPGTSSGTTLFVKSISGAPTSVSLTLEQSPACEGACTVPGLQATLSSNSLNLPPKETESLQFTVNPIVWFTPGSYNFLVTATPSSGLPASGLVTVHLAGFNMTASESPLNFTRGTSLLSTITIDSVYGYSGTVTLSAKSEATGPLVTISPASFALPSGGSISTTLNLTSQAQGSYKVTISGQSGKLSQDLWLNANTLPDSSLPDFSLTVSPSSASVAQGQTLNIQVQVSSVNGCIGIVRLSDVSISNSYGEPLVTVNAGATVTWVDTLEPGSYNGPNPIIVTVTGTCGQIVHSVSVTLTVT